MNRPDVFIRAYTQALYFRDTGGDHQAPKHAELSDDLRLGIEAECRSFMRRFGAHLETNEDWFNWCDRCGDCVGEDNLSCDEHGIALCANCEQSIAETEKTS